MKKFKIKINVNTILIIVCIVLALLYLKQCDRSSKLNDKAKISEMNIKALNDSVRTYKTKNGDLVFQKSTLIASEKELKKLNKQLYDELSGIKGDVKIVFKEKVVIKHDTIEAETKTSYTADGKTMLIWKYDTAYDSDNFQKISGRSIFTIDSNVIRNPITFIDENMMGISLVTGLTEGKDNYEIFVKSKYPGFSVTKIDGAIIDKKMIKSNESRLVFGPSIGYGLMFNGGTIRYGVNIGVNLTYNLNKSIKKIFRPYGL